MDKDKIYAILKSMDNFDEEIKEKYIQLILIAINHITAKLKDEKFAKEDAVLMLCASLVNLWITTEICANSPTGSFSGNGYRIRKDSRKQLKLAKKLFETWRAICAYFLTDEGFSFFAVKEFSKRWTFQKK